MLIPRLPLLNDESEELVLEEHLKTPHRPDDGDEEEND
jgi:hypothetical protein